MKPTKEVFAERVRAERKDREWTQEKLAARTEIDQSYISRIERGVASPSLDVVDIIARAFKVEPAALLREEHIARRAFYK